MEIYKICYNWFMTDGGEDYNVEELNIKTKEGVPIQIKEHSAVGEGDKWFYDVYYEDGHKKRIFNPNQVFYK
jgi:hypothetical protein